MSLTSMLEAFMPFAVYFIKCTWWLSVLLVSFLLFVLLHCLMCYEQTNDWLLDWLIYLLIDWSQWRHRTCTWSTGCTDTAYTLRSSSSRCVPLIQYGHHHHHHHGKHHICALLSAAARSSLHPGDSPRKSVSEAPADRHPARKRDRDRRGTEFRLPAGCLETTAVDYRHGSITVCSITEGKTPRSQKARHKFCLRITVVNAYCSFYSSL